ncbi:response regulator [Ramlibacter sp. G-1-2-2]|uniref:Response regulator n=1 Tax=Ramlibacter agri TaxID=2728837 RepID=A0A848H1H6_9BURK|nr:response regulator [Ramlibacter agri]NML42593.1 response regulator [Ramlibacter agri]
MNDQEIFGLTDRGRDELHSGATTLPPVELELLVRIDGSLSVAQLRAGMVNLDEPGFQRSLHHLRVSKLIEPVQLDTFALQLQSELDNFAQAKGTDEADAGVRSLKRSGYFVRIARPRPGAAPVAGRAKTATIVEDDTHLAGFVSSYLQFEGFTVRVATNRQEVLAEFRKPPVPDLVLLDVVLPDVDGFEVLASLRRHNAFKTVPVIMLTGKATREAVLKGMAGGADGYVTKPFEPEALMNAVHTVMGAPTKS